MIMAALFLRSKGKTAPGDLNRYQKALTSQSETLLEYFGDYLAEPDYAVRRSDSAAGRDPQTPRGTFNEEFEHVSELVQFFHGAVTLAQVWDMPISAANYWRVVARRASGMDIDVVTDQILFLFIGAIKLQIQNNSNKPWELVNQSISNFLTYEKQPQKNLLLLSMLTIIVIIGFSFTFLNTHKSKSRIDSNNPLDISTINESGSETVSSLVNLYEAMKSGDCQLPQAAMLQSGDREAFISFVNEGKVDIKTAPRLKNALNYATCLYPQKLMNHPL